MPNNTSETLVLIKEMMDSAESSLKTAKNLLLELAGGDISSTQNFNQFASNSGEGKSDVSVEEGSTVVEGVFNGEQMIGAGGKVYPVPANYASKSKLVEGDVLKLTIKSDGIFQYKQIGPIARKHLVGPLINDEGQYKVIVNGKGYHVLLASVTYFKAKTGDHVTIIVPENQTAKWGAIENVIPKTVE